MQTTIQQLDQILQDLLLQNATQIGCKSGFVQRQRQLNGASIAQAWLEDLCHSAHIYGVNISPQDMHDDHSIRPVL